MVTWLDKWAKDDGLRMWVMSRQGSIVNLWSKWKWWKNSEIRHEQSCRTTIKQVEKSVMPWECQVHVHLFAALGSLASVTTNHHCVLHFPIGWSRLLTLCFRKFSWLLSFAVCNGRQWNGCLRIGQQASTRSPSSWNRRWWYSWNENFKVCQCWPSCRWWASNRYGRGIRHCFFSRKGHSWPWYIVSRPTTRWWGRQSCTNEATAKVLGWGIDVAVDDSSKGSNARGESSGGVTHAFIQAWSFSIVLICSVESLLTAFFSAFPQPFSFPKISLQAISSMWALSDETYLFQNANKFFFHSTSSACLMNQIIAWYIS